jgi:hypothetical protein
MVYPLLLASLAYVWDPTLPPPSLPAGAIRIALPLAAAAGSVEAIHQRSPRSALSA